MKISAFLNNKSYNYNSFQDYFRDVPYKPNDLVIDETGRYAYGLGIVENKSLASCKKIYSLIKKSLCN